MNDQSYTTNFSVDAAPGEVFDAINNVQGWWHALIEGDANKVGGEFIMDVPDIHHAKIRVTELVPGQKVVWRVVENWLGFVEDKTEWVDTEIRFDIAESMGTTEVRFTHVGLVPDYECYDVCNNAWGFYIGASLRNLITTGKGQPIEKPDEVTVGQEKQF